MSFDRAAFNLRRDTFEEILAPELTPEQRLREQLREQARATCPCCGYPTIRGRKACDICALCGWEDDGQDDAERAPSGSAGPDVVVGGVNHNYTLHEARENFAHYFTMYRPTDRDFEHERAQTDVKRKIAEAYDRCVDGDALFWEADAEAIALLEELG